MLEDKGSPAKTIWAYAYQILPERCEGTPRSIMALLDRENANARDEARTWRARAVLEQQMTHILVVSDGPEQNRDANRHIEAELRSINVQFEKTAPMQILDDETPSALTATPADAEPTA